MTTRTTQTVVRFSSAFFLRGFDAPQPAGEYRVDHDEESIDGISWPAWRRVSTFIHLPAIAAQGLAQQMVPISPMELAAAQPQEVTLAIDEEVLTALSRQTGLSREQLIARLSRVLPHAVDELTPDGRLPPDQPETAGEEPTPA